MNKRQQRESFNQENGGESIDSPPNKNITAWG